MANTQTLRRRIRSVRNTQQITKAMELVAAAKMRRVMEAAERSRIYSDAAISILQRLVKSIEAQHNIYFNPPAAKAKLYIILTSDGGLVGAFNSNVFNLAHQEFINDRAAGIRPKIITIGRKGAHHFSHLDGVDLLGEYENVPDSPDINVFAPVLETIGGGIQNGDFSQVKIIYTEFRTSLIQQAKILDLVPVKAAQAETTETENKEDTVFEFEPDAQVVLESAIKLYFESSLRRARIESAASQHAMQMMSMNNANRNAGDLIDNLTLELNATRQAAITQEMAEIIGGANAIA